MFGWAIWRLCWDFAGPSWGHVWAFPARFWQMSGSLRLCLKGGLMFRKNYGEKPAQKIAKNRSFLGTYMAQLRCFEWELSHLSPAFCIWHRWRNSRFWAIYFDIRAFFCWKIFWRLLGGHAGPCWGMWGASGAPWETGKKSNKQFFVGIFLMAIWRPCWAMQGSCLAHVGLKTFPDTSWTFIQNHAFFGVSHSCLCSFWIGPSSGWVMSPGKMLFFTCLAISAMNLRPGALFQMVAWL